LLFYINAFIQNSKDELNVKFEEDSTSSQLPYHSCYHFEEHENILVIETSDEWKCVGRTVGNFALTR